MPSLRRGLEAAAKDTKADWVQIMSPHGDALFLRRAGLVSVLRELKGLDWDAGLTEAGRLTFWWPRGRLTINLLGSMDGERSYPMPCKPYGKWSPPRKKHNYVAAPVAVEG